MEKLAKNLKHHFILIMVLCHRELATAGSVAPYLPLPLPSYSPLTQEARSKFPQAKPDTTPKIPAYCLTINGTIISPLGKIPSIAELTTDHRINTSYQQLFDCSQFHKNPATDIVEKDRAAMEIINYCLSQNAELDVQLMWKNHQELFGKTNEIKQQNFSVINEIKKEYKGHIVMPVIVLNKNGLPENFLEINSGKYILVKLDALGAITDESIQSISAIRISKGSLAVNEMVEKAQAIFNSGKTIVDVTKIQKQLDSIQRLGTLYEENIDNSNKYIVKLNEFDYDQLSKDLSQIDAFVKEKNHKKNALQPFINFYAKTSKSMNEIKVIVDTVRTTYDSMNTIAQEMPGIEPKTLSDKLNEPRKYTIPVRFISDPLQNKIDKVNLFFMYDDWEKIMENARKKIDELEKEKKFNDSVTETSQKIDDLSKKITEISNQKKDFELLLFNDTEPSEKNLQQGKGENRKNVQLSYEKLQLAIITVQKSYDELLQSIKTTLDSVQDAFSPLPLTTQQGRLIQLTSTLEANEAYRKKMPFMVEEAYKKLALRQDEEKEIADLRNEVNTNIQTLAALLAPILAEIDGKRDASDLWNSNAKAIENSVANLNADKAKVDEKLNTTQKTELKKSLLALGGAIVSALNQENVVKHRVIVAQMVPNYIAAQNLISDMKGVPKSSNSFPAVLEQYNKDKKVEVLTAKYNAIAEEKQKIKERLEANAATLETLDQKNSDVITFINNINPFVQASSQTNLDTIFYTYVAQKMPKPVIR